MELELSDDQQLFAETTRRYLEASCPLATVRELADKEPAGYEADWWRRGAELGWTSMLAPDELGGGGISGRPVMDLMLVAEEMGRLVSPGPLLPVNVVTASVGAVGSADQRAQVLPGLLSGETTAAWCLAEPGRPGTPDGVALAAAPDGTDFVLHGRKGPVEAAEAADHLLVTARGAGGLTQFLLPARTAGVTVTPAHSLDLVRRYAMVDFDRVRVPADAVLGAPDGADGDVERQWQLALAIQCAEMVGAADRVFDFTLGYAFDRYSFGRPLASYQALKHRFADMKMWLEACHATAGGAARAVDTGGGHAAELVSVAKSYIGDHAPRLLQDCVQMHGGIGVTWEHDLHLYLRRVTQDRVTFGTPREHRERIARLLGLEEGR